jgi:hypothetical protein
MPPSKETDAKSHIENTKNPGTFKKLGNLVVYQFEKYFRRSTYYSLLIA